MIAGLLVARRPDLLFKSQFWAEDGAVFFVGEHILGFWKSVFLPYAGYLHTLPRLIAGLCHFVPIRWTPLAFYLCSLTVAAFCCSAFYWPCFRELVRSDALRAACCLIAIAAIPTGGELIMSVCTLQTFLTLLAVLLLYRNEDSNFNADRRLRIEVPLAATQVLIALTAPGTLLLVPLQAKQFIQNRGWRRFVPVAVTATLIMQLVIAQHSHEPRPKVIFNILLLSTAAGGVGRSILCPILGQDYLASTETAFLAKLLAGFGLSVVLVTALVTLADNWSRRRVLLAATYVGIGSVALAMAGRNLSGGYLSLGGIRFSQGERYFFVSSCMFIFLVAVAIEKWLQRVPVAVRLLLLAGIFFSGMRQNFRLPPLVDLAWPANAAKIEQWDAARGRHESPQVLTIPINPPTLTMKLEVPLNE